MKIFSKIYNLSGIFALLIAVSFLSACEKIEMEGSYSPMAYFESVQALVNTESGKYDIRVKLSKAAQKDITVKMEFVGNVVENEHFSVESKEIKIPAGSSEGILPVTILNENIWDEELDFRVILAPGTDYAVDPKQNSELKIKFTKDIILPVLSFVPNTDNEHTNPFLAEKLTFNLSFDSPLLADTYVALNVEGDLTIGRDFLINGGNTNKITLTKGLTSYSFDLIINKKDIGGYNKTLKLTLTNDGVKFYGISQEKSSFTIRVTDPSVDFTPIMKSAALLGGSGNQIEQAIKATDGTWSGKVVINCGPNNSKANYLKTYKNLSYISAFQCNANTPGGDVLRLSDMLNFATTDTVIADYGAGKTTRFFTPSDSLLRFVALGENPLKGTVTSSSQKFKAKLVLKVNWETGTNGTKQWHVDSKSTGGVIANSVYPSFSTIEVELVKIEGTYDFTLTTPEVVFDAWFRSSSPYFMRNVPSVLAVAKTGDMYKVSYRYTPK